MEYCIQAWRPHLVKDIDRLERVQRRATRMIRECKGKDYELRLKNLNLTTLETRRTRADMIEVWKIVNGLEGISEEVFFSRFLPGSTSTFTRGHMYKFCKKRFNSDTGKYSFKNRVISEWNLLPADVAQAKSIDSF